MECLACHTPNTDGARFCAKCGAPLPVQKAADADPLIGAAVGGRYRVTGILGEGGMGRVYVGEQQMGTSVRKVAIKTLLSQFAKDPQIVARFMREVGTVSELEHPNTIKVFDFGQIEGTGELYIAMEMLQGKALDDVLSTGQPLPPERVDRIIGQVCGSLQEAHDKGIVHRDLKPANIFLTTRAGEEDVVKVLDFGIAKSGSKDQKNEQKLTQQGTILGTPPYMSPEQFTGRELDPRSDIYSLAVVTYEMLTGRLPYEADTPWQWMTQHMSAHPLPFDAIPAAAHVPPKMRDAVMRALAKEPAQRPASVRDFFEDLTIGGTRMSVVGLGTGGVGGIPTMSGAISGPSTQMGQIPSGGSAPARTVIGEPMMAGPHGPTTAGGQAFPTPPPGGRKKGGSGGAIIGIIVALVVIGGGVGGFLIWKGQQSDGGDETASAEPSASATATAAPAKTQTPTGTSKKTATAPTSAKPEAPPPKPPSEDDWKAVKTEVEVTNAKKLGCECKSIKEWVRVLCVGKNDTNGTPTNVTGVKRGSKGDAIAASKGVTMMLFQFKEDTESVAKFDWTDKSVTFTSKWPKGKPKPSVYGEFDLAKATPIK